MAIKINMSQVQQYVNDFLTQTSKTVEGYATHLKDQVNQELHSLFHHPIPTDIFKNAIQVAGEHFHIPYKGQLLKVIDVFSQTLRQSSMTFSDQKQDAPENPLMIFDPYFTGYYYIAFDVPSSLRVNNIDRLLGCTAKEVSNITFSIDTTERYGFNKTVQIIPVSVTYEHTITITFIDLYDLPVSKIMNSWRSLVIDATTGFHRYKHIPDFKGNAMLAHFDPTGKTIVYDIINGIFPISTPTITQSSSNVELLNVQVTFSFDRYLPYNI